MCIIVAKEKGIKLPTKEVLETCFDNNPDGAGFMYVKDGKVIIDKGYMDFKGFYKRLKKIDKKLNLKDKALVMHFRIGTSGYNDKGTTHPFPISEDIDDLRATYYKSDLGVAHNGIIKDFDTEKDISDTQNFIMNYLTIFKTLNKKFLKNKKALEMIKNKANSKLCFLDNKENITYIGDFIKDTDTGIVYSNNSYECKYSWKSYTAPTTTTEYKNDCYWNDKDYSYGYDDDDYYGGWYDYKEELTVDEFSEKIKNYTVLNEGDIVDIGGGNDIWQVEFSGMYYLTDTGDIYELYDGIMSLVCTDAVLIEDYGNYCISGYNII